MAVTKRELEDINERLQETIAALRAENARLSEENRSLCERLEQLTAWSETSWTHYQQLKTSYERLFATIQ